MARNRTRNTQEDATDNVVPPVEDTTPDAAPDAAPDTENPEQEEVPLSQGKGGRYTMQNGRRVLRTD